MNRKSFCLLTALLLLAFAAVSGVAAQEAAPAAAPALAEEGIAGYPTPNVFESEWNGNFNSADPIAVGDVVAGKIKGDADIDYFRLDAPNALALIDVDAAVAGSALDARVCLYDEYHGLQRCWEEPSGADPLIFIDLWSRAQYISIQDANYPNESGDAYTYTLSVYRPLLVSAATDGRVAGIPFKSSDILAHYDFSDGTEKWMMFFDASDVGITRNVVALGTWHNWNDIDIALQSSQMVKLGDGTTALVTPYDLLYFDFNTENTRIGPNTVAPGYIGYYGARYGLSTPPEKIDAIAVPWWISTTGTTLFASGETVEDEDISNLPYGDQYFDGSAVSGLAGEDVVGADYGGYGWYLTIAGSGVVDGLRVNQKNIFVVDPYTMRVTGLYWQGPAHHFNYNIDAFDAVD